MCFVQSLDAQDLSPSARKSRSKISKVLFKMLFHLKFRNFQVSVLSCDGEKAVAMMVPELNDHGIVVSLIVTIPKLREKLSLSKKSGL